MAIPFEELLIQRNVHLCCNADHPNFVKFFKMRFAAEDKYLFDNKFLQFDIDDEMDAKEKMLNFIESISQPLSEEVLQYAKQHMKRDGFVALNKEAGGDMLSND